MADTDYTAMWRELGLDLEAHDGLMKVLGQAYGDIFLSQGNRPQDMQYLDFVLSEIHGLRIQELLEARAEGRPVVGTFCLYVPEEIILAVGGIGVGLCAGANVGTQQAETILPANTCALIKSFVGFELANLCPYMKACDLRADGIIHYALLFCTPYLVETHRVRERCKAEGIPLLAVETDYSMEDMPQLETRIGAFLELLGT